MEETDNMAASRTVEIIRFSQNIFMFDADVNNL